MFTQFEDLRMINRATDIPLPQEKDPNQRDRGVGRDDGCNTREPQGRRGYPTPYWDGGIAEVRGGEKEIND